MNTQVYYKTPKIAQMIVLLLLTVLFQQSVFAQPGECPQPTRTTLNNMCYEIENRATEEEESPYAYRYEATLEKMACVEPGDSPETVIEKVQRFWNSYYKQCTCDRANFVVPNGNILKYVAQQNFEMAMFNLVKKYRLNLNYIDPADKRTLLDFVYDEWQMYQKQAPGSQKVTDLKKTFDFLKENGAKRAKEL